ncbi:MAG: peptide deformylase [Verrucomicrobia bacterium]|nr:peptide deformylase [Verrucomicrobiota bacterium]
MILPVVKYGHPVLRAKGAKIESASADITKLIADMFETMYASKGIGLAAQQVGQVVQLAVIDVRGIEDRPSTLELDGKPADVESIMPLVLINPELTPSGESITAPEGCLSFPEIYADVTRQAFVTVKALNAKGKPISFKCGGLLARAVQHETDHLNGILFIDRMSKKAKDEIRDEIELVQAETKAKLQKTTRTN